MNLPFPQAATTGINKKYDDLVHEIKSSVSPLEKASNFHDLFKAMQEDRLGFFDLFQKYQLPELQASLSLSNPIVDLCKAGDIYYCPQDDKGIKVVYSMPESSSQWSKELLLIAQWNVSQAYTNAYAPKPPQNV